MAHSSTDGVARLRKSGVGVVLGGIILAAGVLLVPLPLAASTVLIVGLGGVWYGNRPETVQGAVGLIAVGGIGLVESIPGIGLGIEPLFLAALAIVFGIFDVVAGLVLRVISPTD
ncbi:hypothetical protein ACLI4Z_04435 [Natrialbaceae archaeon A-arb3/5]